MDDLILDVNDLIAIMKDNLKNDIKNFNDLVTLIQDTDRQLYIEDIECGLGIEIERYIRFWNKVDEGIPAEERKPIKIFIDSCGGSLTDSLTIIDAIKMSKTPVIGIAIGCAYSGGFFILISCHKRYAYPHASFLFHEGATGTQGTASQFENYTAFYKKQLIQLKNIVVNNTNITEDEYKEIKKDDVWYSAEEALEKGIIDEISEGFVI